MKNQKLQISLSEASQDELFYQAAFHQAGHAVSVYLRNQQLNLPPIFFEVILGNQSNKTVDINKLSKFEGGRLIEHLPYSLNSLPNYLHADYLLAYEADIINLLAGFLSEAKYIALRDDKIIDPKNINWNICKYNLEHKEFALTNQYIECFVKNMQQCKGKIKEFFLTAYDFINNKQQWKAINDLALYITSCKQTIIGCEEIILVITKSLHTV